MLFHEKKVFKGKPKGIPGQTYSFNGPTGGGRGRAKRINYR